MTVERVMLRVEFDRIPPGAEVGPGRADAESAIYVAAGEIVAEPVSGSSASLVVRAGDVLYEAPSSSHVLRNVARTDALALRATLDHEADPGSPRERPPAPQWGRAADGGTGRRAAANEASVRRREAARIVERDGMRQRILVKLGDFGTTSFKISEIELAAGATTGWHRHQRSEHVAVVLEGRGTVRMGSEEETIEPLKGVRIELGHPHAITNIGRTPLRYLLCATPAPDPLSDREDLDPET